MTNAPKRNWQQSLCAAISGVLGSVVVGMWADLLRRGWLAAGLRTVENDALAVFHLIAEQAMGFTLLTGAAGVLAGRSWGRPVQTSGLGMTIYSTVNSLAHSVKNRR